MGSGWLLPSSSVHTWYHQLLEKVLLTPEMEHRSIIRNQSIRLHNFRKNVILMFQLYVNYSNLTNSSWDGRAVVRTCTEGAFSWDYSRMRMHGMRIMDYLEYYQAKEWVIRKRFHSWEELAWELIRGSQKSQKNIAGSCILWKEHFFGLFCFS